MFTRQSTKVANEAKISGPGAIRPDARELFSNMIVDTRQKSSVIDRKMICQFLREEFGENRKFSESFIDRVLENLKHC